MRSKSMQTTLRLPTKSDPHHHNNQSGKNGADKKQRHSKSGSFQYNIVSATDDNRGRDGDWKKMQNIRVIARFRPKNKRENEWSKLHNVPDRAPKFLSQLE